MDLKTLIEKWGNATVPTIEPDYVVNIGAPRGQITVEDPSFIEDPSPSSKWGTKFILEIFGAIILFAMVAVLVIVIIVKRMEHRKQQQKKAREDSRGEKLASALTPYKWYLDGTLELGDTSSFSSLSDGSASEKEQQQQQQQQQNKEDVESGKCQKHISKVVPQCALCAKDFQDGVEVYESNNLKCRHIYHKRCLDKWLNFQYSCPQCNEVFALQTH